jgi:hypothetical protein
LVAIIPLQLWGIIQELKHLLIFQVPLALFYNKQHSPYLVPFKTDKQRLVSIFGRMIKNGSFLNTFDDIHRFISETNCRFCYSQKKMIAGSDVKMDDVLHEFFLPTSAIA